MARKVIVYGLALIFTLINFPLKSYADAVSKVNIKELIVKHAMEMGFDPALALSIAKAESNFAHEKKSRYGAIGVFQLMPSTARKLGYNPYEIQENIKCGITYYKMMYKMFGSTELALAAYNAGPGNVRKYKGIPPFKETKKFISSIMTDYNTLKIKPDPVIAQYLNAIKEISNEVVNSEETTEIIIAEEANDEIDEAIKAAEFRMQQDAILNAYLEGQGI